MVLNGKEKKDKYTELSLLLDSALKAEFKIICMHWSKAWSAVVEGFVLSTVQAPSEKLMPDENLTGEAAFQEVRKIKFQ